MVQGIIISNGSIIDLNPATGETIGTIPTSTQDDIQNTITKSIEAQATSWSSTPLPERIALLKKGCHLLSQTSEELATLITQEMGKPITESRVEVAGAMDKDEYLDLIAKANEDEQYNQGQSLVIRDPLGVVAVISPWNFPCDEILLLALPALAAGNTVIVKPSEVTPLVGAKTVEAVSSVLPPGVLQFVQGDGTVGRWLVESDGVDMVAMTGSTAVGKKIMESCASNFKRLVLELGGKDPMVVFADADLDLAASDAVCNSLSNTGQVCCSIERVYVDQSVQEDFEQKVVEIARTYKVGNGLEEGCKVGPLVSTMQRDRVDAQVDIALKHGAKLLYKSSLPESAPEGSSFAPVTVLGGIHQNMDIQKHETFGPVVSIGTFDGSEDEAARLANDTEYGLASCVYTTDNAKATRVARRIRAGQVGINCVSIDNASSNCPWVGHKKSGFGYHSGWDGWRQFSVPKSLVFAVSSEET